MLFDEPLPCPQYAALTFDGLAGTPDGHTHLIIRIGTVRAHLGPNADTIGRRALILLASLANSPTPPRPGTGPAILSWLSECWSTTRTALADETAQTLISAAESSNPPRACTCGHSIDDHADDPYDDSCDLCDCDELVLAPSVA